MGQHNVKNLTEGLAGHSDPSKWAQDILSSLGDAIISTDVSGKITYLNPAAERITGWSVEEALGMPMTEVIKIIDVATGGPPHHLSDAALNQSVSDSAASHVLIRRDGIKTVIEGSVAGIDDPQGRRAGKVMVLRVLPEEARENALRTPGLAHYDSLTNLPNRELLRDRLTQALAMATRYGRVPAVLFIDLDHFKDINAAVGRGGGDRILQSVASRLVACVRSSDTVCRYSGDEFVVLLSEVNESGDLEPLAKKILGAIAVPHYLLTSYPMQVTASAGVSIFPDDGREGDTLIRNAETAMHFARQSGGNQAQGFDRGAKKNQ